VSLFKRPVEMRTITSVPVAPFNVGSAWNPRTIGVTNAMSVPSVAAAISLLTSNISTLPLDAYRASYSSDGTPERITPPVLLREPSPTLNLQEWLSQLVRSICTHGNAYGYVTERDGFGYPSAIEWLDPASVVVDERAGIRVYLVNGTRVSTEDIVHIRWQPVPGSVVSPSPLDSLRHSVAIALGAMDYKNDWFSNGGVPPGVFKNIDKVVDSTEAETIKERLVAAIQRHQPIVHGSDWDYSTVQMPATSAEYEQTMKSVANAVASVYGVPASRIGGDPGGSMTYSTVEMESIDFVTYCLRPWLERIERHLSALLPSNVYVCFDTDELLRTDTEARWRVNLLKRQIGATSVNEIRANENEPPIPGGDDFTPLAAEITTYTAAKQAAQDGPVPNSGSAA
jgi:HK97 family phage portal protein